MEKDRGNKGNFNTEKNLEIRPFNNNSGLSFIHRKAEKISCAIHLVTNHLPSQEPLKWVCRSSSLDLIKDIFSLRSNFSSNSSLYENLSYKLAEILSFLDLLVSSGFISESNHSILRVEITNLSKHIEPNSNLAGSLKPDFNKDFFNTPEIDSHDRAYKDFFSKGGTSEPELLYKGQDKGHISKGHLSFRNMSFKDAPVQARRESPDQKEAVSSRKQSIIRFIKDKKQVNIKDITSSIKDCSEKTIQRDLVSLMESGVLKREGERRWSRYSLA